jgi:hypothetical protein
MLRRLRTLALLSLSLSVAPLAARAGFPPGYPNSTVPPCIALVGSDGANASGIGTFTVVVRDLANNPVPGVMVRVDITSAPDLRFCAQQLAPGILMDCPTGAASAVTDLAGRAVFTLMGAGLATTVPGSSLNNGRIYADGFLIGSPTVSAYDLDGASGVGANDFSLWFTDFVTGAALGRSDYDCSGSIGANDLSFWLTAFGSGTQLLSCAATCP